MGLPFMNRFDSHERAAEGTVKRLYTPVSLFALGQWHNEKIALYSSE